jgi:hypothetical protein
MSRPSFLERRQGGAIFGLFVLWLALGVLEGLGY